MGLRVLSLFSGIGAFETALDEEDIDWQLDHYCEIDKYACMSYNQIHGTTDEDNLKDVTQIDYSKIGDIDLITYGFPCQDISVAGHQKGFFDEKGNQTRSGLFFNAADVIRHTRPKFAIFENVKNLTGKKFKAEFETVLSVLDELGYNTYWKVLNAKDYGVPQNRERVFGISIRKDIDHGYDFPLPVELKLRLKDILEDHVDEKYYLSEKIIKGFIRHNENHEKKGNGFIWQPKTKDDIASCVTARVFKTGATDNSLIEPTITEPVICRSIGRNPENPSSRVAGEPTEQRIEINTSGCSHTLTSVQKDNYVIEPKIKIVGKLNSSQDGVVINPMGISKAHTAGHNNTPKISDSMYRIRKLTPRECWRLMGFQDKYFDRVHGVSNTQLYKQAGNSIVVDVLRAIFRELKKQYPFEFEEDDL